MDIARLGSHPTPVGPEIETTAVKPPSPGTPRETNETASLNSTAWSGPGDEGPEESIASKRPLDDPALKAVLSEKLGGAGAGYSGPQIRMDRNIIGDDGEDGGGGGPEAPSGDGWSVSKGDDPKSLNSNDGNVPKSGDDDNNGPTRGVGFNFTGRPGREGDGHTTAGSEGATNSSSTSTNSTSSSSSSGTTSTGSTSSVHPQKK